MSSESQLIKRAVQLFPRGALTDEFAVRQMRQKWVRASMYVQKRINHRCTTTTTTH